MFNLNEYEAIYMVKRFRNERILMKTENENIAMLAEIEAPASEILPEQLIGDLPILPLRNMVMFPNTVMPVNVGRKSTLKLINYALKNQTPIVISSQVMSEVEEPALSDLFPIGVIGKVLRIFEMPGRTTTAILQAIGPKVSIDSITETEPYLKGTVTLIEESSMIESRSEAKALIDTCRDLATTYIEASEYANPEASMALKNMDAPEILINFICSNFPLTLEDKFALLSFNSLKERAYRLIKLLNREIQLVALKQSIQQRTREDLDKQQKEYFLQQQMKNIMDELGNGQEDEIEELRQNGEKKRWSKEVAQIFEKELARLARTNQQSPDYNIQLNYLQTMLDLPWNKYSEDNLNLKTAEKVLNKDHYGMEKVKERILEHLAVLKLKGDMKSPILCLYGPPGVGKTSLGKSIAAALKRKYVRIALGGISDEAEIRGHRKTYIGAMPGRLIKSLLKAETSNPVMILDEIDKLGRDYKGDPSSALLEVLDPEQNHAFHDNYLDIDYDLSKIMFIATANSLETIPAPLRDRMEIINVTGYILEEKVEIARRHLLPKALENNGLTKEQIKLPKATIEHIIESYTSESGVRNLEKMINKIMRKVAVQIAKDPHTAQRDVKPEHLKQMLGMPIFMHEKYFSNEYAGLVTGLAYTSVGGEILFIETSLNKSANPTLNLTGNLGNVMKESAMLALQYLKANCAYLDIPAEVFNNWNVHMHVPEGAVPKDGPSAGIALATALASAFTQRKVKVKIAMTGEITLTGRVLPIGGVKEKILAAKRAGIKELILCEDNRNQIEEIQPIYLEGLTFHYVKEIKQVWDLALTNELVKNPIDFKAILEQDKQKKETQKA